MVMNENKRECGMRDCGFKNLSRMSQTFVESSKGDLWHSDEALFGIEQYGSKGFPVQQRHPGASPILQFLRIIDRLVPDAFCGKARSDREGCSQLDSFRWITSLICRQKIVPTDDLFP